MKINNIKALDYQAQGTGLVLTLTGTTLDQITGMDAALLRVETDDGDLVEALAGYRLARVTYEAADGAFTAVLERGVEDATAKALDAMTDKLAELDAAQKIANGPVVAAVCAFAAVATEVPDDLALEMATLFPTWEEALQSGAELTPGRVITQDGQPYRVAQAVTPQAHQAPHNDGMLAIYRPIDEGHAGTREDPIPWLNGMDCVAGNCYSYNGAVYQVAEGGTMSPCVWPPDTAGMWQWVKVEEV